MNVYIMGRGHSGSTILDIILGNSEDVVSVGELVSGMSRWESEICACKEQALDCEFWKPVVEDFESKGYKWNKSCTTLTEQAHIKNWIGYYLSSTENKKNRHEGEINREVFRSISKIAQRQIVVDSSKESTRALFLLKYLPDSKVIHLIRNPMGIINSDYKRTKQGLPFKFLRRRFNVKRFFFLIAILNSMAWFVGNMMAELIKKKYKDRVLTVKYEQLCKDPISEFSRIEKFIGHPLNDIKQNISDNKSFEICHNVGGNKIKFNQTVEFQPHSGSKIDLPSHIKFIVKLFTFPLAKYYKY